MAVETPKTSVTGTTTRINPMEPNSAPYIPAFSGNIDNMPLKKSKSNQPILSFTIL